jgi:hypothetical protein
MLAGLVSVKLSRDGRAHSMALVFVLPFFPLVPKTGRWLADSMVIVRDLHIDKACGVGEPFRTSNPSGIARGHKARCTAGRHEYQIAPDHLRRLWARRYAPKVRASALPKPCARPTVPRRKLWSIQMEAYGGPAQPSPSLGQCLSGGYGWLEIECNRCKTRASIPLDAIRRPRDTPIWKLEASLKCRSCRKGRYAPPVRMIKLSESREISPYRWVHPDEER